MILRMLLLGLIICCSYSCSDSRSSRDKWSDKILVAFAKNMKGKGLSAAGIGGGCTLQNKINLMSVTFDYEKVMTLEEARELIVECSNELLRMVNSDPEAAQYFENFPIEVDILGVGIIGKTSESENDNIKFVFTKNDRIVFIIDDGKKGGTKPNDYEESFAEAQEIIALQKSSIES